MVHEHNKATQELSIIKIKNGQSKEQTDYLAVEEPLEIRIIHGTDALRRVKSISITMRTPSNDKELALGFLLSEGIITDLGQILDVLHYNPNCDKAEKDGNVIDIYLAPDVVINEQTLERNFYTSSSCGVCGKASIAAIRYAHMPQLPSPTPMIEGVKIPSLPDVLREQQSVFDQTGGLHAAGLFDMEGNLVLLREDVGRHNAVDKLIGAAFLLKLLPLNSYIIVVSGRASFELVQKSLSAGIPMLVAVGAPSSLAVDLAKEFGMTVIGFARNGRCNVYTGMERVIVNDCN